MIRLRFGQTWRREGAAPTDSVALTLHGVDLLMGANEEQLPEIVEAWTRAWETLGSPDGELAQVSLSEARLELLFHRASPTTLELTVASLGRPARILRPAIPVEVSDLRKAWIAGVSALWRDLEEAGVAEVAQQVLVALNRVRAVPVSLPENPPRGPAFGHRVFARAPFEMGFELWDPEDRLLSHRAGARWPLASLLVPGIVTLRLPADAGERTVRYSPPSLFLFALELSRQGQELLQSPAQSSVELELGGLGPSLEANPAFLPALFQLGVDLAFAIETRNSAQRDNPYLRELVERCQSGLRELRTRLPLATDSRPGEGPSRGAEPSGNARTRPLEKHGRLRRLKFVKRYERHLASAESAAQILPLPSGKVWISGAQWAERYDARGTLTARRHSELGVAVSPSDWSMISEPKRVVGYSGSQPGARWLQPHDGLALGPVLKQQEGMLFTQSESRLLVAFHVATGREAWRFAPFRPARIFASIQGGRALVGTEAGDLFGLSALDGQLRYRFEAPLPFIAPPITVGTSFVAVLSAGEHSAMVCADVETGRVLWTKEFGWARASEPAVAGGRLWLAGQRGNTALATCLDTDGEIRFEVELPFTDERYFLLPMGRSMLVAGTRGAAARISPKGLLEYSVPAASEAAWRKLPPRTARGILFLPGDPLRVLDARSGSLLSELRGGPALLALETDARLNVYALDEGGTLKAFRLSSYFAVV